MTIGHESHYPEFAAELAAWIGRGMARLGCNPTVLGPAPLSPGVRRHCTHREYHTQKIHHADLGRFNAKGNTL